MADCNVTQKALCACWYENSHSYVEVRRKLREKFGRNAPQPPNPSILRWHTNLLETGSILEHKRKRQLSARTEDNAAAVIQHFSDDPHSSQRRAANHLDISRTTIRRILKDLKWHPYKLQLVQQLHPTDKMGRMTFAEQELDRISQDPNRLLRIAFSDEAHFHIDGGVNRHNCRYWAPENPNWVREQGLHSPRTTVWAAIWEGGIIGPIFFDQNVDSESYLEMLGTEFWPQVEQRGLQDTMIFMQDGAPPHFATIVRHWLNQKLPGRWIGRGTANDLNIPWPPRSPDITPCDYFLWGFLKSKVYTTKPESVDDLKQRISNAFNEVTVEMRQKTMLEFKERLQRVIENNGDHVEVHNS